MFGIFLSRLFLLVYQKMLIFLCIKMKKRMTEKGAFIYIYNSLYLFVGKTIYENDFFMILKNIMIINWKTFYCVWFTIDNNNFNLPFVMEFACFRIWVLNPHREGVFTIFKRLKKRFPSSSQFSPLIGKIPSWLFFNSFFKNRKMSSEKKKKQEFINKY